MREAMKAPTRKKLDTVFSKWVRMKDADHAGIVACFTCGKSNHWTKMHAGHFVTRAKYATRWDDMNVKPQCPACNLYGNGQQYIFGCRLDGIYGEGTAEQLMVKSHRALKMSEDNAQQWIDHYNKEIQELIKSIT